MLRSSLVVVRPTSSSISQTAGASMSQQTSLRIGASSSGAWAASDHAPPLRADDTVVAYLRPGHDKLAEAASKTIRSRIRPREAPAHHLDRHGVERARSCARRSDMLVPALKQARLATEISRAANDWTIDICGDGSDDRLYGAIIAPSQDPQAAAAEIRRVGGHPRMVGVVMATTPLGKPLGHPVYGPIYAAAAELGLVIVVHAGGSGMPETLSRGRAGGGTARNLCGLLRAAATGADGPRHQPHRPGGIERYPGLRILVVGAGAAWLAPFLSRFDTNYHGMRTEAPWLRIAERPVSRLLPRRHVSIDPAPTPASLSATTMLSAASRTSCATRAATRTGMRRCRPDGCCAASGMEKQGHADERTQLLRLEFIDRDRAARRSGSG